MRYRMLAAMLVLGLVLSTARGYVEVPYSLGQMCREATTIVVMEVVQVNKEKGLVLYKKVADLKGKHPQEQIKHNIGKRGFHEREWKTILGWAEVGKKAVFFHNGGASETCIGTYWYQCYPEGEWWGMSHAEPFLLRTFFGEAEKLIAAVEKIQAGQEVIVPCLADGNKAQFHLQQGKVQRMRASLKRANYDARRDFVGFGAGDGDDVIDFKTIALLPASAADWKFLPASQVANLADRWKAADFADQGWRKGKAPIGYGEAEIATRSGTPITEKGQPFVFRREVNVPADVLQHKGVTFRLTVASDDSADVYLNGELVHRDPEADHEFAYWNSDIELQAKQLKPGRNVLAVLVRNKAGSSDLYLDAELTALVPLPPPPKNPVVVANPNPANPAQVVVKPGKVTVDKQARTVAIDCAVAPRKLAHLADVYPIEVVATYPAPQGQKAHETVVVFAGFKPSEVHQALTDLGLKPGVPAKGEGAQATGPELTLTLEFKTTDGPVQRASIEKLLIDRKTNQPLPAVKWHFTGSAMKQLDPEKNDKVYAADYTGTLIAMFPVTDDTVIQSSLTLKEEAAIKLEVAPNRLPKEGAEARLIIGVK